MGCFLLFFTLFFPIHYLVKVSFLQLVSYPEGRSLDFPCMNVMRHADRADPTAACLESYWSPQPALSLYIPSAYPYISSW